MRRGTMRSWMPVLGLLVISAGGCGDDETAPTGHSSPEAAVLVINGESFAQNETIALATGELVNVEVQLLDEHGDVILDIEDEHFVKLDFTPVGLGTTVDVPDHHFQKILTTQAAPGTGTINVGYGHDADADERSFGPFNVTVGEPVPE